MLAQNHTHFPAYPTAMTSLEFRSVTKLLTIARRGASKI